MHSSDQKWQLRLILLQKSGSFAITEINYI